MKNDERLQKESKRIESFAYQLLKWGLFAIIVVRLVALKQEVTTLIDVFLLWLVVVTLEFILMSSKGIPLTYPIDLKKKEKLTFFIIITVFSGIIAVLILLFTNQLKSFTHGLVTFGLTSGILAVMFITYHIIYQTWNKKFTHED